MQGHGSDEQIVRADTIPGLLKLGPYLCVSDRLDSRERENRVAFDPCNESPTTFALFVIFCPMQPVPEFG